MPDVRALLHAGPSVSIDGAEFPWRQGNEGQGITSRLHGVHYESGKRGNIFMVSTVVAGLAVPISTTTAPTVVLWNPTGSGKNLVPIRCSMAYVSGTTVGGAIGLQWVRAGAQEASGSLAFTVFNRSTVVTNGLVGGNAASVMLISASGTNTLAAATTNWFYTMFEEYAAVAASAITAAPKVHDFDGMVVVPPGIAIYPAASAASGALLSQTFIWEEVAI